MSIPVLLDTDIGTDIDDAYALILAATRKEMDLRAVTIVNNDVVTRSRIARRLLTLIGRDEVPVALGHRNSLTPGVTRGWIGIEGQGIELSNVNSDSGFADCDAAEMIAKSVQRSHEEGVALTIVTIGAMTNLAGAMQRFPEIMTRASRVISMACTFEGYGQEKATSEHNLACDPAAFQTVLRFGLPITLIGLNVTSKTRMDAAFVESLERVGGPLAESLAGMHRVWFQHIQRDASPMHDGLAVASVFRPELISVEAVHPNLIAGSAIVAFSHDDSAAIRAATGVDVESYHVLLFQSILEAARASREIECAMKQRVRSLESSAPGKLPSEEES